MKPFIQLAVLTAFVISSTAVAASSQAEVGSPVMGYAYDAKEKAIRPILGIPGAAVLGDAVGLGFQVASAAISPKQDLAVVGAAEDSALRLVFLRRDRENVMLSGSVDDQAVFSPSGNTLGLYQKDASRLRLFTGLPETVRPGYEFTWDGPLAAMAISDDGEVVVAVSETGIAWISVSGGNPASLPLPGSIAAVAFRPGSHDLLVAGQNGGVSLLRHPEMTPEPVSVAAGGETAAEVEKTRSSPIAVQFSSDGLRAYFANSGGVISAFDLATGASIQTACRCNTSGLYPLGAGIFRLNEISNFPLMLLDTIGTEPRVWFVPPGKAATEGSAQ